MIIYLIPLLPPIEATKTDSSSVAVTHPAIGAIMIAVLVAGLLYLIWKDDS